MAKQINPSLAKLWHDHDVRRYGSENPTYVSIGSPAEARALKLLESGLTNAQYVDLEKLAKIESGSLASLIARLGDLVTHTTSFIPAINDREVEQRFNEILRLFALGDKDPAITMQNRKLAKVFISTLSRPGFLAAKGLYSMGIGSLLSFDATNVRLQDTSELGYKISHIGLPRYQALREVLEKPKNAMQVHTRVTESLERVDCALIIANDVIDPATYQPWLTRDIPHIAVTFTETGARVSQMVFPGTNACLACNEIERIYSDSSWLLTATQLNQLDRDFADTASTLTALGLALGRLICVIDGFELTEDSNTELVVDRSDLSVRSSKGISANCGCRRPASNTQTPDDQR